MNDKLLITFVVFGIVAVAGLAAFYPRVAQAPPEPRSSVFYISARIAEDGGFNVSEIRVRQGDHVVVFLRSLDTTHGIVLRTPWVTIGEQVFVGQQKRFEFDARLAGLYQIFCANPLCSPSHHEMVIDLVVEPA